MRNGMIATIVEVELVIHHIPDVELLGEDDEVSINYPHIDKISSIQSSSRLPDSPGRSVNKVHYAMSVCRRALLRHCRSDPSSEKAIDALGEAPASFLCWLVFSS
jgi:hypothetical protein